MKTIRMQRLVTVEMVETIIKTVPDDLDTDGLEGEDLDQIVCDHDTIDNSDDIVGVIDSGEWEVMS